MQLQLGPHLSQPSTACAQLLSRLRAGDGRHLCPGLHTVGRDVPQRRVHCSREGAQGPLGTALLGPPHTSRTQQQAAVVSGWSRARLVAVQLACSTGPCMPPERGPMKRGGTGWAAGAGEGHQPAAGGPVPGAARHGCAPGGRLCHPRPRAARLAACCSPACMRLCNAAQPACSLGTWLGHSCGTRATLSPQLGRTGPSAAGVPLVERHSSSCLTGPLRARSAVLARAALQG